METLPPVSVEDVTTYRRNLHHRAQARLREKEKRRQRARQVVGDAVPVVVARYPTVRRVYLFGSVTRPGAFGPDSDVDIGVEGASMALCLDIWRDLEKAVPEWQLDVRSLRKGDPFSERVCQKGELVYERAIQGSQVGHPG